MKYILILTLCLTLNPVSAENNAEAAAKKSLQAVTVFIDVSIMGRKKAAAKHMTESHNEFAAFGYELVGVSPYTENGDLEGFFVSYKKTR